MRADNKSQGDTAATVITPLPAPNADTKGSSSDMVNDSEAGLVSGFGQFHSDSETGPDPRAYESTTLADVFEMAANPQAVDKAEAKWIIPSSLMTRKFKEQEQEGLFYALWADFDENPQPIPRIRETWLRIAGNHGTQALFYSSRSATEQCQKSRMIVPLDKPLNGRQWILAQECLNDALVVEGLVPDRVSQRPGQLCYLPNRGEFYQHEVASGESFDAAGCFRKAMVAKVEALRAHEAEVQKRIAESAKKRQQRAVTGFKSPIDAFNAGYRVEEVLIRNGYSQRGRDFRHPNSNSGSYSARVFDNGRVKTLSASDPLFIDGEGAHDAFGAFCVLEHGGDDRSATRAAASEFEVSNVPERVETPVPFEVTEVAKAVEVIGDEPSHERKHPLAIYKEYDLEHHVQREFVLDGVVVSGVVLIAGSAGVGKSSSMVPIFARVTHLVTKDDLRPLLKRRVIYVTEDSMQVEEILASMRESGEFGDTTKEELNDMFRIVDAYRLEPVVVAEARKHYDKLSIKNVGYSDPDPETGEVTTTTIMAAPLVVFDTSSATLQIENESDNSKVSEAVSILKQAFTGMPVVLMTHVAKVLRKTDPKDMSARGAGAWEADANQVMYLAFYSNDPSDNKRWLDVKHGKHRFRSICDGVEIKGRFNNIDARDVFGKKTVVGVMHGFPNIVTPGKREEQAAERARVEAANRELDRISAWEEKKQRLLEQITQLINPDPVEAFKPGFGMHGYITGSEFESNPGITGNKSENKKMAQELCSEHKLNFRSIPKGLKRNPNQANGYILPSADLEALESLAKKLPKKESEK